jgi:hypothetical protein
MSMKLKLEFKVKTSGLWGPREHNYAVIAGLQMSIITRFDCKRKHCADKSRTENGIIECRANRTNTTWVTKTSVCQTPTSPTPVLWAPGPPDVPLTVFC